MKLRPYQEAAVAAIIERLETDRSTLLVMPSGCGKTQIFVSLAGRLGLRTLVLAHRDELINQAAERITQMLGVEPAIEKADQRAPRDAQYVVASVQTLRWPRLGTWPRGHFGLVVADEAHHAPADTHREILDYFGKAKVLGVTATPDRLDKKGLGEIFESVAYTYELPDAIRDGWLAPITARRVRLEEVDLRGITTRAGDLATNELEAQIGREKTLKAIADALFQYTEGRKTLVYTPAVASACQLTEILNAAHAGCARVVHGNTPLDERRETLRAHAAGDFPFVVSVAVLTEGFDSPTVSCIAMARPTKSRALFIQTMGRGLRLAEGKTDCLVLDFVGATTRHDLIGPEDALAGKLDDETSAELDFVSDNWGGSPINPMDLVEEAKRRVVHKAEEKRNLIAEHERKKAERAKLDKAKRERAEAEAKAWRERLEKQAKQRQEEHKQRAEPADGWVEKPRPWHREQPEDVVAQRRLARAAALEDREVMDEHVWELLGGHPDDWDDMLTRGGAAQAWQSDTLRIEYKVASSDDLSANAALVLISHLASRARAGLASPRQLYFLVKEKVGGPNTTKKEAKQLLDAVWNPKKIEQEKKQREEQIKRQLDWDAWAFPKDDPIEKKDDWLQELIDKPPEEDWVQEVIEAPPAQPPDWLQEVIDAPPMEDLGWLQELLDMPPELVRTDEEEET